MARRTKQEAQETRSAILDVAEHIFQEKGVSRTSLSDIAQAAGVTRGAIYWHFANKADLFNAMMERVVLPIEETVNRIDDAANAHPLDNMRHCVREAFRKTAHDPQTRRVFDIATHKVEYVDEMNAVRERHIESRNDCLSSAEQGIRLAIKTGLLPSGVNARSAAIGMHALVDGMIQNWMLDPDAFDLVREGNRALNAYLDGLGVAPQAVVKKKKAR